jgi:hypothetical protein
MCSPPTEIHAAFVGNNADKGVAAVRELRRASAGRAGDPEEERRLGT